MIARLAQALAGDDAPLALQAGLNVLAAEGIVASDGAQPWLLLQVGTQRLALAAKGNVGEDEALRELVSDLLRSALYRVEEHEACARVVEREHLLSTASFEGLFFHVDGVVFDCNQQLLELLRAEREDFLGPGSIQRFVAPEDVLGVFERVRSGYEGAYVIGAVRKDGTRFRAELQAKQGQLGARPVRVAAVRDVTEREHTQMRLRESEMRLRDLAQSAFDAIVFTRDGKVVDAAGRPESLVGFCADEMIGRPLFDFVAESERARVLEALNAERTGTCELLAASKSGETVPVEVVAVLTTLAGEPVRMSAVRDLRELKRREREREQLQAELADRQRLESLAVLAGGVAHDFNNLLAVVIGNAELLQQRVVHEMEGRLVGGILDAGHRAASLTAQLLAYVGRRELGPREPIDLAALVGELRGLIAALLSSKAELTVTTGRELTVLGNRTMLTQLILNLLTNASDALADQPGKVTLRMQRVSEPDARFQSAARESQSAWVLLEVEDSGRGMDADTKDRIFEPFFSTKERGHGLGLAASLGIVSAHHGFIHVESKVGRGSVFSILLPAHELEQASPTISDRPSEVRGRRRVLVVDDEPLVRRQLRFSLEAHGYEVEEAENGRTALARLEQGPVPDVVLLDVTMPDLSGLQVLERMRRQGLTLPVVLSSGYHDAALDLAADAYQGFLVKPYSLAELYATLERALEPRARATRG